MGLYEGFCTKDPTATDIVLYVTLIGVALFSMVVTVVVTYMANSYRRRRAVLKQKFHEVREQELMVEEDVIRCLTYLTYLNSNEYIISFKCQVNSNDLKLLLDKENWNEERALAEKEIVRFFCLDPAEPYLEDDIKSQIIDVDILTKSVKSVNLL